MKITKTDLTHSNVIKTMCVFEIEDVEPIDQLAYRDSGKLMRPTSARIGVVNGEIGTTYITGVRINKGGAEGAPITREWYRYTDTPAWIDELRKQALAAYRAEHETACNGDVLAGYTEDGDEVRLNCQACAWHGSITPNVGDDRIRTRHEPVSA